jgi:hypothetical protein
MSHLKQKIPLVALTIFSAISCIALLVVASGGYARHKNGFSRKILKDILTPLHIMKKSPSIWAISGFYDDHFYFQGRYPNQMIRARKDLQKLDTIQLTVANDERSSSNFEFIVEGRDAWLFCKNIPSVTSINLNSSLVESKRFPLSNYTRVDNIGTSSFIFRGFDTGANGADQVFLKGNFATGSTMQEKNISDKYGDAGIATDGLLHYDMLTHLSTYVFFFRNQFLCMDTGLHLIYKANTIDTFNTYQTKGGKTISNEGTAYSSIIPSRVINRGNCVSNGHLFNFSQIEADNEASSDFSENAVIDMYNIRNGQYESSFYIPDFKGEKLLTLRVFSNTIVTLYKHYIITYQLRLS